MRLSRIVCLYLTSAALSVGGASAAADGLVDAVCAVQQAVVCSAYSPCERSLPGAINLPALVRIHKDQKMIESRHETGTVRNSPISSSSVHEGAVLLHGNDGPTPWSMRIDKDTGRFVFSVAGDKQGFVGFGICSSKILG